MLMYEKKDDLKQKGKSKEQKKKSRDVVQAKYMNKDTGKLQFPPPSDRPPETSVITEAKRKAAERQSGLPPAEQLAGFTAHHKYPWSRLRDDIEQTFTTIPKTVEAERTLHRLESFSGDKFPVKYDIFVRSNSHRKTQYMVNENGIDNWIQDVCWTPSNIFIGPRSEQREDDPGHRNPVTEIDAHYIRGRRISDVSEVTMEMYRKGGLQGTGIVPQVSRRVSLYEPSEWKKDTEASGTQYYQVEDPYYRDNIFHYQVIPNVPIREADYQLDIFSFSIETPDDVAQVKLRYNKQSYRTGDAKKLLKIPVAATAPSPNKKRWNFNIRIKSGYIYNQFELAMKREAGTPKIMSIQSIYVKRV